MTLLTAPTFTNRTEAGHRLAARLTAYARDPDAMIFGIVRGGVACARAMADSLRLPLYPFITRKLGYPGHREYAVGAVSENGIILFDPDAAGMAEDQAGDMRDIVLEELRELERRKERFLSEARPSPKGRTVILVDDGAATGYSIAAAAEDVRRAGADHIVIAVPVCPPDTLLRLREFGDEAVVLLVPQSLGSVGRWYTAFPQLTDAEVLQLLLQEYPGNPPRFLAGNARTSTMRK